MVTSTTDIPFASDWTVIGLVDANGDGQMDVHYNQTGTSIYYTHYFSGAIWIGGAYAGALGVASATLPSGNPGTVLVRSSISYTVTSSVENLTLVGSAGIDGPGNELDNVLTGNAGANVLTGGAGSGTLTGGGASDTLRSRRATAGTTP